MNWDDLEMALTSNAGECTCYLDLRTGEVQMVPAGGLGVDGDSPSAEDLDEALGAGHLVHIEPLGSGVEYRWMAEFAETVRDARLRELLEVALRGRGAFRRFKAALADHPAERERWFALRNGWLREAARQWLAEHGIERTPAAWKQKG